MPVCLTAAILLALAADGPAAPAAPAVTTAPVTAAAAAPRAVPANATTKFDHVILISVDGLRPDAIDGPEDGDLAGFRRMLRGPHTLQARSDADLTVTLPNHMSMITGRPVGGPNGHGWTENEDPPAARHGGTLHKHKGSYVASMFDVAHDEGALTTVVATKTKFTLTIQSYENDEGDPDRSGRDDGRNKIDIFALAHTSKMARELTTSVLGSHPARSLQFVHFAAPDAAGHSKGWDMAPGSLYRAAVAEVDRELAALLTFIDADPLLRGRVAVILTADHGGGVPFISHKVQTAPEDFLVPLLVWLGSDGPSVELAALNADRRAVLPASQYVDNTMSPQPIRNSEAGNIATQLMGLRPIPGSVANGKHDLQLAEPAPSAETAR